MVHRIAGHLSWPSVARHPTAAPAKVQSEEEGPPRYFVIEVLQAEGLKDVQTFGAQSPFVTGTALPSRRDRPCTTFVSGGGSRPKWSKRHANRLALRLNEEDTSVLIEVGASIGWF